MAQNEMTMAEAKRDFARGLLRGFSINDNRRGLVDSGITVMLTAVDGQHYHLIDARDGRVRQFRSFDTAINAMLQIGFAVGCVSGT